MEPLSSHTVLVTAEDFARASKQVDDFFDNTMLVRYDKIAIRQSQSYSADNPEFSAELEKSLAANVARLDSFIDEFSKTGFQSIQDLNKVECGYPSKLLHIITHFLDGFIGIDTIFYNLIDDSHWLPDSTREAMKENPSHFWLIHLDGYSDTPEKVSLVQT